MTGSISVLILEDQPDDAELMVRQLHHSGFAPAWQRVDNQADYEAILAQAATADPPPDLILADYRLPPFNALRALQLLQVRVLDIPFIADGAKMNIIIDELLLLARVRRQEIAPQPLEMSHIVAEARQRLDQMITTSRLAVLGHGPWVEAVWVNYLSNGIKYGGHPPRLELGTAERARITCHKIIVHYSPLISWITFTWRGFRGLSLRR